MGIFWITFIIFILYFYYNNINYNFYNKTYNKRNNIIKEDNIFYDSEFFYYFACNI